MKAAIIFTFILGLCLPAMADDTTTDGTAATHIDVQGGAILNCFAWSYKDVVDRLASIKAANFTAIQVSSVQPLPASGCFSGRKFSNYENSDIPDWYRVCAPLDFRLISATDPAENTPLGSLADLQAMIKACHDAGIGVVVGVEANQVYDANGSTNFGTAATDIATRGNYNTTGIGRVKNGDTYADIAFNPIDFSNSPFNDPTRKQITQRTLNAGVLDVNTEDPGVITKMETFLQSLYDLGIDGVYWYHAKYIGLKYGLRYFNTAYGMTANDKYTDEQAEGSDFWRKMWLKNLCIGSGKTEDQVLGENDRAAEGVKTGLYFYGNVNLDPYYKGEKFTGGEGAPTIDHDPNYIANSIDDKVNFHALREYTKYMNIVDAWFAKSAMMQDGVTWANGNWITVQGDQKYTMMQRTTNDGFYAAVPSDMVYIAEDENTYLANPEAMYEPMLKTNTMHENRPTNGYLMDVVDRSYASMAGQYGSTIVYFARPTSDVTKLRLGTGYDGVVSYPSLYFIDEKDWTKNADGSFKSGVMHAYYYGGSSSGPGWPGTADGFYKVGQIDGHNVIMWKAKVSGTPSNIIFNNGNSGAGTNQTGDLTYKEEASFNMAHLYYWCYFEDTQDWTGAAGTAPDMTKIAAYAWGEKADNITGDYPNNYGTGETNFTYIGDHNGHHVFIYKAPDDKPVPHLIFNNNPVKGDDGNWLAPGEKKTPNIDAFKVAMYVTADGIQSTADTPDQVTKDGTNVAIVKITSDIGQEEPSSRHFASDVVSKVNLFHKAFKGEPSFKESAYNSDATESNISAITRQDGAILVMRSPASKSSTEHTMVNPSKMLDASTNQNAEGKAVYNDIVSNKPFTVTTDNISGQIGPSGVAVLMDPDQMTKPQVNVYPKDKSSTDGTMTIMLTPANGMKFYYQLSASFNHRVPRRRRPTRATQYRSYGSISEPLSTEQKLQLSFDVLNKTKAKGGIFDYRPTSQLQRFEVTLTVFDDKGAEVATRTYTIYNPNNFDGSFIFHQLYIHLPEVAKGRMSIYAWNDQDGTLTPLTKKDGDNLATYQPDESQYVRPVKSIYQVDENQGDLMYCAFIGTEYNGASTNWNEPYRCDYGMGYNDVYDMGGNQMNRYTIGIPHSRMNTTWFRLSYHKKSGYTQLLDAIWCDDDMFLDVAEDAQGNLGVGRLFGIIGDALYDNATWNYTTPQPTGTDTGGRLAEETAPGEKREDGTVVENTFWDHWTLKESGETRPTWTDADGQKHLYPHVTLMRYEPDETQAAIKKAGGNAVQVSSYTGQFINGKTFRFGYPFDFVHNLVPLNLTGDNIDEEDIADWKTTLGIDVTTATSQWKGYLKDVESGFWQHNYIKLENDGNFFMLRGKFAEKVKEEMTNDDGTTASIDRDNITWQLPSGLYTVRLFDITSKNSKHYYYYTISRPTLEYDTGDENGKDVQKSTGMDLKNDKDVNEKSTVGAYYTTRVHMGNPSYAGSAANINNNLRSGVTDEFHPDRYKLEFGIGTGSETNSDFPETGNYRVVYQVGHGNAPIDPTGTTTQPKGADTESAVDYYLGWNPKKFAQEKVDAISNSESTMNTSSLGGYWCSYADGLARKKPAGVHAYYCTGIKYGVTDANNKKIHAAIYLKEYQGDVLPANTGFLLHFTAMPDATAPFATRMNFDEDKNDAGEVTKNWLFLQAQPASEASKTSFADIKTNYLVPLIACDPTITTHDPSTAWKELPSVKRPDAEYDNYWMGFGIPEGQTEKKLGFYRIGKITKGFEKRMCFVSFPRNAATGDGSGDEDDYTFGAKDADIIFGWDPDQPTNIRYVNFQDEDPTKPAPYYDLLGRKVDHPEHGVYIHRGRKVVIK